MKRIHIGLDVADLERSVRFYTRLLGVAPTVHRADYAKWLVDDPRLNLSVTARDGRPGDVHFGIEAGTDGELDELTGRLDAAEDVIVEEPDTVCCYHRSRKTWTLDADDLRWEVFHTREETDEFGHGNEAIEAARGKAGACCDGDVATGDE